MCYINKLALPCLVYLFIYFSSSNHLEHELILVAILRSAPHDVTTATHYCHSSTLSSVTKWVIFGQSGKGQEQNSVQVKPTERHWHLVESLQFPSLQ